VRAGPAALVALVLVFCGTPRAAATTPDRAGPPAATETPTGKPLAPDDVHRQPGEPLAAPIIEGPIRDRRLPSSYTSTAVDGSSRDGRRSTTTARRSAGGRRRASPSGAPTIEGTA
jgi:hypothetical protein